METGNTQETDRDREEEEEEDLFNVTIEQSGCAKQHYTLQDCFAEKRDWRKCATEMKQFKTCMDNQRREKLNKPPKT